MVENVRFLERLETFALVGQAGGLHEGQYPTVPWPSLRYRHAILGEEDSITGLQRNYGRSFRTAPQRESYVRVISDKRKGKRGSDCPEPR
ncbi:MAG: hypothetical protein ABSF61_11900 [Anaerolineales bacterium]|jgi:hypothetical protein